MTVELMHEFDIAAPPDTVFDFLLDAPSVVTCVPGVTIDEVVDESTFEGSLKVKVGPVTVRYRGSGYITAVDKDKRVATIRAEGEEQGAAGTVAATMEMSVVEVERQSRVTIRTDLAIVGRVATMGRGVLQQVSNQLVGQAARKIESRVLCSEQGPSTGIDAQAPAAKSVAAVPSSSPGSTELAVGALLKGVVVSWLLKTCSKLLFNVERFAARTRERIDG
ncbi:MULTISPECIES: SRPBCC family protein [Saccharopolyspora]|uniref:SRPBCC family protein n=1 Tax=Saccharopolyspora TaxID=1835 RepID=UPI0016863C92|nr:SRPBCC family protein [Saccharopolyspora pogona]